MLVADLAKAVEGVKERSLTSDLAGISIDREAKSLHLESGEEFEFDEQAERTVSSFLGINRSYLSKCPPDLKAHNLNYWLQRRPDASATIEALGDRLVNMHKPGLPVLPVGRIATIITTLFDLSFEIANFKAEDKIFHADILTNHQVEVPVDNRIEGRREVGDITHGGVRILANPTEVKSPSVVTYLHRLRCTNGTTSAAKLGQIRIKGQTIDQVMESLELAARKAMGELDAKLASYAALAERKPPGSPLRFAHQLGQEYRIPARVMQRVLESVKQLPEDASLYDVQNIFTQTANGNVKTDTAFALQELGGEIAFHTDHIVHRCSQCERLLPDAV